MKYIKIVFILIIISACGKKIIDFDINVKLEDYYTQQPLEGHVVVFGYCNGAGLVSGRPPCDSIDFKTTNKKGMARYTGTYPFKYGRGHEFFTLKKNGYPRTTNRRPESSNSTNIMRIKPIMATELHLTSVIPIDSVALIVYVAGYRMDTAVFSSFQDSLTINIPNIPDEMNGLIIERYQSNTYIGSINFDYTPTYTGNNILHFEIY